MRSMTGFGAASLDAGGVSLSAEVRTVNHKHLQIKVRLPGEFLELEGEVEALVKRRLDRGSVSLGVHLAESLRSGGPELQPAVAARLKRDLLKLAKDLGLEPQLSLDTLARLPGVVAVSHQPTARAHERERKAVLKVVEQALSALESMREAEGLALAKDLAVHRKELARLARAILKRMPQVVKDHQAALTRRVEELLAGRATLSAGDLAREVALLADKVDVSEELARLESHLSQFDAILGRAGPVGRTLDFLVQELLREANTIGSKCTDAAVAHAVVEMKTAIERLREQVQNVE
jgi:uncharacterized protein (TIGR00255 family)